MAEEWDVFEMLPGAAAPVLLATLYEAYQKTIRVELDGSGAGSFAINRSSPGCTEEILAQGNLVKVRIPEIHDDYIFAFFLETGDFTLISSQEEGGEMLTFGGRGNLSYLEYGIAWSTSYIDGGMSPIAGLWNAYLAGTGAAPGQILRRLIEEFQDPDRPQFPIPLLTIDFDYDDDSTADPWDVTAATNEFKYQVGEDGLAILLRLIETGITVQMSPNFLLQAYNPDNYGRDLTGADFGVGVVRFEKGVNIAVELRRELAEDRVKTHMLVGGEADKYGDAALADAATRVTKEGFIPAFGVTATALDAMGAVELAERLVKSDLITFPIANRRTASVVLTDPVSIGAALGPVATDGFYLPGPPGSDNGDFWVGDLVRVHTGSGPFDYPEVDAVVQAITITRDDDNKELIVIPELVSPEPTPVVPIEQYGTNADSQSLAWWTWPEGIPGPGNLEIVFVANRGGVDIDVMGVPESYDNNTNISSLPIPGTGYTNIDAFYVKTSDNSAGITMAYRDSTADDTQFARFPGGGGWARLHYMEIAGLSGAPAVVVTSANQSTGGTTYTSPSITVPSAGYIIGGFSYATSGPHDRFGWGGFTMSAVPPAHVVGDVTAGWQNQDFGGYSVFLYRYVSAAGAYTLGVTRAGDAFDPPDPWGWIVGFWAGAESPTYPA